ncbi:leukocyte surface antigen CD47-like isoform X2 [Mesocricetus auratus]|uniref:Leukocyte surface antigen CD47 n=1 Tax=Mesocricetus auratus TaxID=10036 RepID=A0ABM2XVG1_MESAU|nr:leukocyte surface antigen CD47-like isoform X2 [Mesocricetus auratus]
MWPLVAALLLSSLCCGSAQLLFKNINSVTARHCNKFVVIPCYVTNLQTEDINDLSLIWRFGNTSVLIFQGYGNTFSRYPMFSSATISTSAFLKGNASLKLKKNEAKAGNYICEVTELNREGKKMVELKYQASWFAVSETILIIIFPFLTILLFWVQFAILLRKYKSNPMNKKTIVLSTAGILMTVIIIVGAILFIPGSYSKMKSYGLIFFVSPTLMPVFLQYYKFKPAIGRTLHAMIIFTVVQALGFVLIMAGMYLTVTECEPKYGPLLILGLAIITLVELLGLIYMKWLGFCLCPTIQGKKFWNMPLLLSSSATTQSLHNLSQ